MAQPWPEVTTAAAESRHELVLSGGSVSKRIDEEGLDERIYEIGSLNYLEVSKTSLSELSQSIGDLHNLTNLVLHGNKLTCIPESIEKLTKLKLLDLSRNQLSEIPLEITSLSELQTLNLSGNCLTEIPDVDQLCQLHVLDISYNELTGLPQGITSSSLTLLSQIFAQGNQLQDLPCDFSELPSLKFLDISDNKLTVIPSEIAECLKLKELKCGGNKLKDRRLAKMMDQCTTKAVMGHLMGLLEKERKESGGKKQKEAKKKKKKKGGKVDASEEEEVLVNLMKVLYFKDDGGITVKVMEGVQEVRPYIVCCVVRNLNFSKTNHIFKRFITLQTKLHEAVCCKRQAATIATHDMHALKPQIIYDAWLPEDIKITPLFKHTEVTAAKLVAKLRQEAEEIRKEKKRNTVSGVYKYLDLLKGKSKFPCLVNGDGVVISFPPITNCDGTKVTKDTTSILIEVTSSVSLDTCKHVMEEVLQGMLEMGLGDSPNDCQQLATEAAGNDEVPENEAAIGITNKQGQVLTVEQAKVVDHEGTLKVVYPSRVDLQSSSYRVERL